MEAWDGIGNDAAYNHAQTPRGASAHGPNSKDASKKPEAVNGVSGTALRFTDYDVVATRSAMTLRQRRNLLYVDGVLRYSRDIAFSSVDYTMKLGIGNEDDPTRYPTHSYHWNGAIDEVYVFDRALSADEIVALKDGSWAAVNALNPESDLSIAADAALDLGGTEQTGLTLIVK